MSLRRAKHVQIFDGVSRTEAVALGKRVGVNFKDIPLEQFQQGIKVEKEHANTVNRDTITIARIARDHLMEDPNYYTKLKKVEGDKHAAATEPERPYAGDPAHERMIMREKVKRMKKTEKTAATIIEGMTAGGLGGGVLGAGVGSLAGAAKAKKKGESATKGAAEGARTGATLGGASGMILVPVAQIAGEAMKKMKKTAHDVGVEEGIKLAESDKEFKERHHRQVRRQVHLDRAESKARMNVAGGRGARRGALAGGLIGAHLMSKNVPSDLKGRQALIGGALGALAGSGVGRSIYRKQKRIEMEGEADKKTRKFKEPMPS